MKTPFGIKLGLLLLVLITSLVGAMLTYFNQYTATMLQSDLKRTISDVTRTGAMVFQEEDRAIIQSLRYQVYQYLPDDYVDQVERFIADSGNDERKTELLSEEASQKLQSSSEFQHIVQLLRRVQEGSRDRLNALRTLPQTNITDDNASRVAWAYLMITVPNVSAERTVLFLADSNYEKDNVSPDGNPIGNMYDGGGFFVQPFIGESGNSDGWYYDEQFDMEVMSALVPIKNDAGEVIASFGVDYNVDIFADRMAQQLDDSWTVLGISIVSVLIISAFITIWVSVPLAKLRSGAEQLSQQDFQHVINIGGKDEFGLLANTMNKVSKTLGEFTRNLDGIVKQRTAELSKAQDEVLLLNKKLTQENAHLGAEVDSLIALRKRLMPEIDQSLTHQGYDISFHYLPSQSVGGDFWQLVQNTEQSIEFVIGQMSGYGLETATATMQVQGLLSVESESVDARLDNVNKYLHQLNESINLKLFSKALNVKLEGNQLEVSGQLEDPINYSMSEFKKLEVNEQNLPLGLQPSIELKTHTSELSGNQNILFYTSGFINALARLKGGEAAVIADANFSAKEIIELSGLAHNSSQQLVERLKAQEWFDDFEDDICFITVSKRA